MKAIFMAVAIAAASLYGPSGAAAHSFRVGLLLPLIGPSAGAGKQFLDGFMLATKERDAHPGRRKMRSIPPPPARRFFSSAWAMRPGNYRGSRAPPISFPSPSGWGRESAGRSPHRSKKSTDAHPRGMPLWGMTPRGSSAPRFARWAVSWPTGRPSCQ